MSSSNLKWVYGPTHRAQDVSNDAVDKYKSIIQQLYLDQNMTREDVLSNLQDVHGFLLSTNQFSKATKRWGFYKQPRQVRPNVQPPESITMKEEALNPLNQLEELSDLETHVLDTIDETEAYFQPVSDCVTDSQALEDVQEKSSDSEKMFGSKTAIGKQRPQPSMLTKQLQKMNTAPKLEQGPYSISKKSRTDYLTCCYLFQEALYCLEKPGKSLHKREHRVPRSDIDRLFAPYRRDKDKLLANPNISLDMWSILCLYEPKQSGIPYDLLDRLDTNDLRFMTAMRACLGLCKTWIELVGNGLPSGALQFDSLFLHQNTSNAKESMRRPLLEQHCFDIWQEAGYLFAFVWSNEQLDAVNSWSWLRETEISGLSPTYFLAIICRMIVHQTALSCPDLRTISDRRGDAGKPICGLYLQTIDRFKHTTELASRSAIRLFIYYFINHQAGLDIDSEENRSLEGVRSYQRTAEKFVFGEDRDILTQESSLATTSHRDTRVTCFGSLASSKSTNSPSYSTSYLYAHQQCLTLLSSNPAMTRSLASGSSRGSSLNSFRAFQAASTAMATCLKEDKVEYI